jgi:hypothetical protein
MLAWFVGASVRRLVSFGAALGIILGFHLLTASPAEAAATMSKTGRTTPTILGDNHTCGEGQSAVGLHQVPISKVYMCETVNHAVWTLNSVHYNWWSAGQLCDWWVDFDYFSTGASDSYFHNQGQEQQSGCKLSSHGTRQNPPDLPSGGLQNGQVCATLFNRSAGTVYKLVRTCQNINN